MDIIEIVSLNLKQITDYVEQTEVDYDVDDVDGPDGDGYEESRVKLRTANGGTTPELGFSIKSLKLDGVDCHFLTNMKKSYDSLHLRNDAEILEINEVRIRGKNHMEMLDCFPEIKPNTAAKLKMVVRTEDEVDSPRYKEIDIELLHISSETIVIRTGDDFYLTLPTGDTVDGGKPSLLRRWKDTDKSFHFFMKSYVQTEGGEKLFLATLASTVESVNYLAIENRDGPWVTLRPWLENVDPNHPDERFFIKHRSPSGDRIFLESFTSRGTFLRSVAGELSAEMTTIDEVIQSVNLAYTFSALPVKKAKRKTGCSSMFNKIFRKKKDKYVIDNP